MFGWIKKGRMKREIIINSEKLEKRVAVLENGQIEEFQVEHPTEERIVGSIYKGRIQNLEHDLQAAFVDIGLKKNAFLHYWDMLPEDGGGDPDDENGRRRGSRNGRRRYSNEEIEKRFPAGSEIVVQVTKGPIGTKGPRVTASLSIAGRYMVLMPGASSKGVSRKIADDKERARLKKIVSALQLPPGVGCIVRTVAAGARKRSFLLDLRALLLSWEQLQTTMIEKKAPACLYSEPDLVERVVRDWLTEDVDRIVIDSRDDYERVRSIAQNISRRARGRVNHYDGALPVFDHYDVEKQIADIFKRKVNLKCGGCLVFDETEALVAVDVNTGRHKGSGSQEDAILEVNTEAVEEVARQLRLRNIGGLVVIDLIDMKYKRHQAAVYRAMKAALKRDRARINVLQISDLGIMEMSRQRAEESVQSLMYADCPYCQGRGTLKSSLSMSVEIQRQVSAIMRKGEGQKVLQVTVHPTVLDRLRREDEELLVQLEQKMGGGRLSFRSDPSCHAEAFAVRDGESGDVLYSTTESAQ